MEVRQRVAALLTLSLVLVLGACDVGEYGTSAAPGSTSPDASAPPGSGANETSFDAMIKPLVTSCLSCHSGGQQPTLTSYSALQAKFKAKPGSTNPLVTKGDHAGIVYFNATDKEKVRAWIDGLQ